MDTCGARELRADGDPLVVPGREVTTRDGHRLALGLRPGQLVDRRYGVGDGGIERPPAELRQSGGLCAVAHPCVPYGSGSFRHPYQGPDLVEVRNGPWSPELPWQADDVAAPVESAFVRARSATPKAVRRRSAARSS